MQMKDALKKKKTSKQIFHPCHSTDKKMQAVFLSLPMYPLHAA